MNPISRQDVQNIVDISRNRIMERMVTKQDVAMVSEALKNIMAVNQQNQQLLKQSEYQRAQLAKRVATLEGRIASFENEIRVVSTTMLRSAEQKAQQITLPAQNHPEEAISRQVSPQYAYYRPA